MIQLMITSLLKFYQGNVIGITSICELEDGTIVSGSFSGTIRVGDYTIEKALDYDVNKVIALPKHKIASCSCDRKIKILHKKGFTIH